MADWGPGRTLPGRTGLGNWFRRPNYLGRSFRPPRITLASRFFGRFEGLDRFDLGLPGCRQKAFFFINFLMDCFFPGNRLGRNLRKGSARLLRSHPVFLPRLRFRRPEEHPAPFLTAGPLPRASGSWTGWAASGGGWTSTIFFLRRITAGFDPLFFNDQGFCPLSDDL